MAIKRVDYQHSASTTVMGPAANMARDSHSTDPPLFSSDGDLQEWRRKVVRWVDLIKTAAEKGTDRTYKTIWATLGRWLYDRGLPSAQQSIVDEAQAKVVINYKQDDQIAAVKDIVELVAVDPPIAMVSSLISSFDKVSSCRRKKNEDLSVFVSRFRGFAAEHLMHSNASSSSQIGEVLAITLLNNANIEEGTLTNAKLQLISLAEARSKEENNHETQEVSKSLITSLARIYNSISQSIPSSKKETDVTWKRVFLGFRADLVGLANQLYETVTEIRSPAEKGGTQDTLASLVLSEQRRCKLHLEDAVSVLGNLTLTTGSSPTMNMKEVENLINRNVQKALLSVSKSNSSSVKGRRTNKSASPKSAKCPSEPSQNVPKKRKRSDLKDDEDEDVCFDCGNSGHRRGAKECPNPSYLTKRIQSRRRVQFVDEKEAKDKSSIFRRGSSSGQGNQA